MDEASYAGRVLKPIRYFRQIRLFTKCIKIAIAIVRRVTLREQQPQPRKQMFTLVEAAQGTGEVSACFYNFYFQFEWCRYVDHRLAPTIPIHRSA